MKIPDIWLAPIQLKNDPDATRELAAMVSKLNDLLLDIYSNLQTLPIVTTTPGGTELEETGIGGKNKSDVVIVHDSTQTNRKVAYKSGGTVYVVDSA